MSLRCFRIGRQACMQMLRQRLVEWIPVSCMYVILLRDDTTQRLGIPPLAKRLVDWRQFFMSVIVTALWQCDNVTMQLWLCRGDSKTFGIFQWANNFSVWCQAVVFSNVNKTCVATRRHEVVWSLHVGWMLYHHPFGRYGISFGISANFHFN